MARRLVQSAIVLWAIFTGTFVLMRLAPGGPFDREARLPDEVRHNLERQYGLDLPLPRQYVEHLWHYARLDFGVTYSSSGRRSVGENIRESFPVSAELGLYGLAIALAVGIPAGMFAASRRNRLADHAVMAASLAGLSVPAIVTGPLLLVVFGVKLNWLEFGGWDSWRVKLLPALTLGLAYAAMFARLARGATAEALGQDYIRTARAKGLPERTVLLRHALRPALAPVLSFLGPAAARILTGSVVVERVFSVPGISDYFVSAAMGRDYPMVMGVVVLYSGLLVLFNLAVDVGLAILDPRVRLEGA